MGFPGGLDRKESACDEGDPGLICCRREWLPTPVFWPGESPWTEEPGRLYSPWGRAESDMTEWLSKDMCSSSRGQVHPWRFQGWHLHHLHFMSHERGFKRIIWRPLQVSLEFGDWYLTHTCKSKGKRQGWNCFRLRVKLRASLDQIHPHIAGFPETWEGWRGTGLGSPAQGWWMDWVRKAGLTGALEWGGCLVKWARGTIAHAKEVSGDLWGTHKKPHTIHCHFFQVTRTLR